MQVVSWKSLVDETVFRLLGGVRSNLAVREAHWWQQLPTLPQYTLDSDSCANAE